MELIEDPVAPESWTEPQGELRTGSLAVRTLGRGSPTVLLHGILGSNRYWGRAFDRLGRRGRLLAPDLLGFGASPRPASGYGPDDHGTALVESLRELEVNEKVLVVGHSLGALVALWLAWRRPDRVRGVVAFGPPVFRNSDHARRHLIALGGMERLFALGGMERLFALGGMERLFALDNPAVNWAAKKACENLCGKRPRLATRLYAKLRPELPEPILEDATRHSWTSYSETLRRMILGAEASTWLANASVPVLVLAGSEDRYLEREFLGELSDRNPQVRMQVWSGEGHDLPLTQPQRSLAEIERWDAATATGFVPLMERAACSHV